MAGGVVQAGGDDALMHSQKEWHTKLNRGHISEVSAKGQWLSEWLFQPPPQNLTRRILELTRFYFSVWIIILHTRSGRQR